MANVNVNAPADQAPTMAPPTRTDDQILPHIIWVPIGKSNYYLDVERSQSNPIYKIAVDILKHTNFFRAFTASSTIPSIYIKQFWDTVRYDKIITPVNNKNAFSSPLTPDALINFVNDLGYSKVIRNLSDVVTNDMFQPWRALTTIINLCLTRKTSGKHKFHPGLDSPLHLPNEEPVLRYLKFSAKGNKQEVFGIPIPAKLITADIQVEPYYKEYLEKVAKYQRYLAGEKGSGPDSPALKPAKATKKSTPSAPKADLRPPVIKLASSQQPEPKPAPTKSQGKILDESVDEGIPEKEPRFDDDEADVQRALEESLKSVYDAPRGPLLLVVIRELDSRKYQSLSEVREKCKEKAYLTPTESSGHDESSSLYAKHGLKDSEVESDEDVPGIDARVQDEGQVGPNPGEQDKGQAGPNPGDVAASQPQSSPVVHAGPNLKHTNLEATNVIPEEPASSTGTLSSLQHLAKDLSFSNLFFTDKPSEADNEKTTVETEAGSMVPNSPNVHRPLQAAATKTTTTTTITHPPPPQPQQSTTDSMLIKCIGELEQIMANLIQDNKDLEERLDNHRARLYTLENLDIPQQILHQRMWETNSYKAHEDHMMLYEALEKSINRDHTDELLKDLAEARKKKKKRCDSLKTPHGSPPYQPPPPPPPAGPSRTSGSPGASGSSQVPPPPPPSPSTNQEGQSHDSTTSSSSKTAASAEYKAWTTTDTRLRSSVSSNPEDLHMDDDMAPDAQVHSSDDEDIRNAHIPKNNWASALASTYSPSPKDWLLAQTGPAFELVKVFHPNVIHLQYQMEECHKLLTDSVDDSIIRHNVSKPLPLGGPPSQVTIQSDFFFNKDLEYLRYGSKGSRPALSILKMKAAYYPDVGLEQMVPHQMWIEEEHTSKGDRRVVRNHMRILSVVRIEVFSMYGYDYIKKIVFRRADLNEHIIAKRDFKYLYPSDFEDMYLLNLQGHQNHLPPKDKKIITTAVYLWTRHLVIRQRVEDFQLGIESYQTQLNLTKPRWDATGFECKHDYTFSGGTLHQIDEALDYRVKEFKVNRMNP
nr:histone deacetylase 14 [Tanacetum cinerariifolium]